MSQETEILQHLQSGKTITPLAALMYFDCLRLSGRIYDLKKPGHKIRSVKYKTSTGKYVARYFLEK